MKTNQLSEFSLINKISTKLREYDPNIIKGIGDDAGVIKINQKKYFLYSCDSLVSGVHFLEKYSTPYQIGRKAAVVNLSDISSMGGKPLYCLVSLFLLKRTTKKIIDELYKGLIYEFRKHNVEIIGGNISRSKTFAVDIFIVGEVSAKNILFRSGAQVGDAVLITGTLGSSAHKKYILNQVMPTARVKEGILIAKSGRAHSMIDISDGLSSDIQHICDESNVGVKLFLDKIPTSKGVKKMTGLNGGEDYELCFTASKENALYLLKKIKKITGTDVTVIGEVISKEKGRWLIDKKGNKKKLIPKGWDHFK